MSAATLPREILALGAIAMVVGLAGLAIDIWGLALQTARQGTPNLIAILECAVPLTSLAAGWGLLSGARWAPTLLMYYVTLAMSFWVFRLIDFLFAGTTFLASSSTGERALTRGSSLELVLIATFDVLWCIWLARWMAKASAGYASHGETRGG